MEKVDFMPYISFTSGKFSKEKNKEIIRRIEIKNGCSSPCSLCPLKNSFSGFTCLPVFFINKENEFPFRESVKYIKKLYKKSLMFST